MPLIQSSAPNVPARLIAAGMTVGCDFPAAGQAQGLDHHAPPTHPKALFQSLSGRKSVMDLKIIIDDQLYTLNVPDELVTSGGDFFDQMDRDMDAGRQKDKG